MNPRSHISIVGFNKSIKDNCGFPKRFFASTYPFNSPGTAIDKGPFVLLAVLN